MMRRTILFALLLTTALNVVRAQLPRLGTPVIRNFAKESYRGGTQNWGSLQGAEGLIWVANNQGLLEFDGLNWRIHPLPNRTIMRSLAQDDSGRIIAGGQGEIGLFEPGPNGQLQYNSLLDRFPVEYRKFEDVWDIVLLGHQLYFLASESLYSLDLSTQEPGYRLELPAEVMYLGTIRQASGLNQDQDRFRVLLQLKELGLFEMRSELLHGSGQSGQTQPSFSAAWKALHPSTRQLSEITAVLPSQDAELIVATLKSGMFKLDSAGLSPFAQADLEHQRTHRIYSALTMRDGRIAVGSSTGGLTLLDASGELLSRYTRRQGLQNNTLLSLMEDLSGNLWLGLDNGISMVAASSPYTRFYPDDELAGTAYAIKVFEGHLYCGTNNGLYALSLELPPDQRNFTRVPGSEGQVWSLSVIRDQLIMGHHEGAFLVRGGSLTRLAPQTGVWTFLELKGKSESDEDRLIAGSYSGLISFVWLDGWAYQGPIEGFEESSRFLASDEQGAVYIAHPYRGAWRAELQGQNIERLSYLGQEQGLPSNLGIQLYAVWNGVVFSAERGTWVYDPEKDQFNPHPILDTMLGRKEPIRRLMASEEGDLWYAIGPEVGKISIDDKGLYKTSRKVAFPELSAELVGGFEHIEDPPGPDVFFATDRGVIQYSPVSEQSGPDRAAKPKVLLRRVEVSGRKDSLLFNGAGYAHLYEPPLLPARIKGIRFGFASTEFQHPGRMSFSWMLEGFEREWSAWSEKTEKEYTNLKPGDYVFKVRTQNMDGQISEASSFEFSIAAPWYASNLARTLYALLIILGLVLLVVLPQRRFAKDKAVMADEQERTLREQQERHMEQEASRQQEIMKLRNEKLQGELAHQNGQLATTTLHLVQKNALVVRLREDLEKLGKLNDADERRKAIRHILSALNDDERLDEDWGHFAMHFDKVHADFLSRLRDRYPQLTPRDHKLCAFLRMNLNSKEIAPLLFISVRGVEISRYRLRKKLGLDAEANLTDFLQGI